MKGEKVLLYNLKGTAAGKKLQPVLLRLGVRVRVVEESEYDQPLGLLAGVEMPEDARAGIDPETGRQPDPAAELTEPMMILVGFTSGRLDELLTQMRRGGVPQIGLKAMLTATNRYWTSRQIYTELGREREAMAAYRQAQAEKAQAAQEQRE